MKMVKLFGYWEEWIIKLIDFHKGLQPPYNWIIPILEFCVVLIVVIYYISLFIPRGLHSSNSQ